MAGAHRAHAVASFVLSEVLEEDIVKNRSAMRTWVLCLVKSIWYCGLTLIVRD